MNSGAVALVTTLLFVQANKNRSIVVAPVVMIREGLNTCQLRQVFFDIVMQPDQGFEAIDHSGRKD